MSTLKATIEDVKKAIQWHVEQVDRMIRHPHEGDINGSLSVHMKEIGALNRLLPDHDMVVVVCPSDCTAERNRLYGQGHPVHIEHDITRKAVDPVVSAVAKLK